MTKLSDALEDVQELTEIRDLLVLESNNLKERLREALHNKAELEFQLRVRLCLKVKTSLGSKGGSRDH